MSGILCKLSLSCFKLFLMWLERWSAIFICGISNNCLGESLVCLSGHLTYVGYRRGNWVVLSVINTYTEDYVFRFRGGLVLQVC